MAMDPILTVVTALSLGLAAALSIVVLRSRRQEQLRAEARIDLLRDLAAEEDDLLLRAEGAPGVDTRDIFQKDIESTAWRRRAIVIAALVVVVGGAASAWTFFGGTPTAEPAQSAADLPLELLSLRHQQENQAFAVTGLVQNPRGGRQLNRVEATVLLFDNRGTMLTSGRAPLDFTALAPGDESPFVIRVPVNGTVARYRVGFRGSDGQVLGHLDRRNLDTLIQRQEP